MKAGADHQLESKFIVIITVFIEKKYSKKRETNREIFGYALLKSVQTVVTKSPSCLVYVSILFRRGFVNPGRTKDLGNVNIIAKDDSHLFQCFPFGFGEE